MSFPFTKMQGAGNDFVVVEGDDHDWSSLAPMICSRNFGAGSDGLLVVLPSNSADIRMRMFNPDGSEDDCGNGLRCLALYAYHHGWVSQPTFRVRTLSGIKEVTMGTVGPTTAEITVRMGNAVLSPSAIPARFDLDNVMGCRLTVDDEEIEIYSLFTGTAHTVIFEDPDEQRFQRLSPLIEHHERFPERTSVLWAQIVRRNHASVRIWERGVGETLACGTGAAAVALASLLSGQTGPEVSVESKGGVLRVKVDSDLSLTLTGPAAFVFEGRWNTGRIQVSR